MKSCFMFSKKTEIRKLTEFNLTNSLVYFVFLFIYSLFRHCSGLKLTSKKLHFSLFQKSVILINR